MKKGIEDFLEKTGYQTVDKDEWESIIMTDENYIGFKMDDAKTFSFEKNIMRIFPHCTGSVEVSVIEINGNWWLLSYNLLCDDNQPETYILSPLDKDAERDIEEIAHNFHEIKDVHVVPN